MSQILCICLSTKCNIMTLNYFMLRNKNVLSVPLFVVYLLVVRSRCLSLLVFPTHSVTPSGSYDKKMLVNSRYSATIPYAIRIGHIDKNKILNVYNMPMWYTVTLPLPTNFSSVYAMYVTGIHNEFYVCQICHKAWLYTTYASFLLHVFFTFKKKSNICGKRTVLQ